jgi:hypothetical protein
MTSAFSNKVDDQDSRAWLRGFQHCAAVLVLLKADAGYSALRVSPLASARGRPLGRSPPLHGVVAARRRSRQEDCARADTAASRQSSGRLRQEVATDGVRKASRSRASDSPLPAERRDALMGRPDEEQQVALDGKAEFTAYHAKFDEAHVAELLGPSMALALRARLRRFKPAVPF